MFLVAHEATAVATQTATPTALGCYSIYINLSQLNVRFSEKQLPAQDSPLSMASVKSDENQNKHLTAEAHPLSGTNVCV